MLIFAANLISKAMNQRFFLLIIPAIVIGLFSVVCQFESSREAQKIDVKVRNLETFARLYGYARWFHPSDEAQEIDWDKFAVLGVQKIENVKSTAALRDTLYRIFSPIVQGLQIYEENKPEIFNSDILLSPDPYAKPVAWQHYGVYLNDQSNIYKSIRINKSDVSEKSVTSVVVKYFFDIRHLHCKFIGHTLSACLISRIFKMPESRSGQIKGDGGVIRR